MRSQTGGIYLHIPFCRQACYYCNFHFSTSTRYKGAMIAALKRELTLREGYMGGAVIETIYFGGGTPSLLGVEELDELLGHIRACFLCGDDMEVTLEGNPDDLTLDYLRGVRSVGINRLSIGIQSLDDRVLASLNRAHSAQESMRCVADAREAGFTNFSVDLMYGLPARGAGAWEQELKEALRLRAPHISAYCLTIEPNTVFGHRRARGTFVPVTEEVEVAEFQKLKEQLGAHGYVHYEISNFCQPSHYAKHNTHYWERIPYLGVGPSAHSYDGETRQYNIADNKAYLAALSRDEIPCRREVLSPRDHINEHIMLGLRTMWGCDTQWLFEVYGYDLFKVSGSHIRWAIDRGLMVHEGKRLVLTAEGQLLADEIAKGLFCSGDEEL